MLFELIRQLMDFATVAYFKSPPGAVWFVLLESVNKKQLQVCRMLTSFLRRVVCSLTLTPIVTVSGPTTTRSRSTLCRPASTAATSATVPPALMETKVLEHDVFGTAASALLTKG